MAVRAINPSSLEVKVREQDSRSLFAVQHVLDQPGPRETLSQKNKKT